jgi:AI-2 transport protein TqsA
MNMNKLSPVVRFILVAAAFVVLVAGMRAAETLLVPFLLSVFIALIFSPMLYWLKSLNVPNALAIILIVLFVMALGTMIGAIVGASIRDFRGDLPEYQARLQSLSDVLLNWLSSKGVEVDSELWTQTVNPSVVMQIAGNTLASFGNVMTNAFLILLTVVFILAEEVGFSEKLAQARGDSPESMVALEEFTNSVNRYLGIKTSLSVLTGLLVAVMLWLMGVDYPVMWGLLAFMLNFVPTIGSIIAAVPALLLALLQVSPFMVSMIAVGYVVINLFVGNVLEPRLMGRGLNLSPLVVFLSLVFWGWVLGPVGMLLSIPLTILVKIGLERDSDTRWVGIMLGAGGPGDKPIPEAAGPLDTNVATDNPGSKGEETKN